MQNPTDQPVSHPSCLNDGEVGIQLHYNGSSGKGVSASTFACLQSWQIYGDRSLPNKKHNQKSLARQRLAGVFVDTEGLKPF